MTPEEQQANQDLYGRIYTPQPTVKLAEADQDLYASIYGQQGTTSTHTETQE